MRFHRSRSHYGSRGLVCARMRGTGQSTEFDVPKVTIWSANGWGLHFAKACDETVYREDQLSETHKQTNILKRRIFASFLFVLLLHLSLIGWYGCTQQINGVFSWSSRILFPTHISGLCHTDKEKAPAHDGNGNYALGLKEQFVFPEIEYDNVDSARGMDIIFVTSAKSDDEAKELLSGFDFPFNS